MTMENTGTVIRTGDVMCLCVCHVADTWLSALVFLKGVYRLYLGTFLSTIFLTGNSPASERAPAGVESVLGGAC